MGIFHFSTVCLRQNGLFAVCFGGNFLLNTEEKNKENNSGDKERKKENETRTSNDKMTNKVNK